MIVQVLQTAYPDRRGRGNSSFDVMAGVRES